MSNFEKIHHRNGSFLADDIRLDRVETIKVVGEEGTVNGLEFIVPGDEAWINDRWRRGKGGVADWAFSYSVLTERIEVPSSWICVGAAT